MDKRPDLPVQEEELHALLDEQLDASARADLERRLALDPSALATLQAWQRQRDALRRLYAPVLTEPVPAALRAAADHTAQTQRQAQQWWRWGGMAASVALAFALGWFSHGQAPGTQGSQLAGAQPAREFIRQASMAHAVFAPEVRHPVEVDSAQQEHLVLWLSKRLGRSIKVPQLNEHGFELVGGRLLPGDDGARAQFMYQNAQGERITLYLGSTPADVQASAAPTEFRFSTDGPVPGFYWVDEGYAYALSGQQTRQTLLKLAQLVYHQL